MTTRSTAAALLISCLALAGCSFDGTGFGAQPDTTATTTGESTGPAPTTTTTETSSTEPTTTGGDLCGNAMVDPGEECDPGAVGIGETKFCLPGCIFNVCGDGFVDSTDEACDDGNSIDDDACSNDCKSMQCGDGTVQAPEQCDDGNTDNSDTCTDLCKTAVCGDGHVLAGTEECDDGANNADTAACKLDCTMAFCGDGLVGPGEVCDDGNNVNDDACPNSCAGVNCGDGIKNEGEQCDDGNDVQTDDCLNSCMSAKCGDQIVHEGAEECDETINADDAACTSMCKLAKCGDGLVLAGTEECDDGNMTDTDACTSACKNAKCGDGLKGPGEECDDGNMTDADACTNMCKNPKCGDGIKQNGEDCDDGNMLDTDACTAACKTAKCGDGKVWAGMEQCDDGNMTDADPCHNDCTTNVCGDGVLGGAGEDCDHGMNFNGKGACSNQCKRLAFYVFVTKTKYAPSTDFNSIAKADTLCANAAAAGALKLPGKYKAWISNGVTAPLSSFFQSPVAYITLQSDFSKTTSASGWTDLTDNNGIMSAIDVDEDGNAIVPNPDTCHADNIVWTATKSSGATQTSHCKGWTSNMMADTAFVGSLKETTTKWTDAACNPAVTCDQKARLYCFEQP